MSSLNNPQDIITHITGLKPGEMPFIGFLSTDPTKSDLTYMLDAASERLEKSPVADPNKSTALDVIHSTRGKLDELTDEEFRNLVISQRFIFGAVNTVQDLINDPHFSQGFRLALGEKKSVLDSIDAGVMNVKMENSGNSGGLDRVSHDLKASLSMFKDLFEVIEKSRGIQYGYRNPFDELDVIGVTSVGGLDQRFQELNKQMKDFKSHPIAALMSSDVKEGGDFLISLEAKFSSRFALEMYIKKHIEAAEDKINSLATVNSNLDKETDVFKRKLIFSQYLGVSFGVTETTSAQQRLTEKIQDIKAIISHPLCSEHFDNKRGEFTELSKQIFAHEEKTNMAQKNSSSQHEHDRRERYRRRRLVAGGVRVPKAVARSFNRALDRMEGKIESDKNIQNTLKSRFSLHPNKKNPFIIQGASLGVASLITHQYLSYVLPQVKSFIGFGMQAGFGVAIPFFALSGAGILIATRFVILGVDKALDYGTVRLKANDFQNPIDWLKQALNRLVGPSTTAQKKENRAEVIRYLYGLYCSLIDLIDNDKVVLSSRFYDDKNHSFADQYPKTIVKQRQGSYARQLEKNPGAIKEILKELALEQIIIRAKDLDVSDSNHLMMEYKKRDFQTDMSYPGYLPEDQRTAYRYSVTELDDLMMALVDMVAIPSTFKPWQRKEIVSGMRLDQDLAYKYFQKLTQALTKGIEDYSKIGSVTDPAYLASVNTTVIQRFESTFEEGVSIEGAKSGRTVADSIMHIRYRALSFVNHATNYVFPNKR